MSHATMEEAVREELGKKNRLGIKPKSQEVIAVLTPTLGYASFWYFTGVLSLIWPMNKGKGILPTTDHVGGEIAEMRNRLIAMMLAADEAGPAKVTHVMWLDDDVVIGPAAMLALASHDRDIASGVYFSKFEKAEPLIFDGPSAGTGKFVPGQTRESWGWSQGLSLVKLDVYRRMRDEMDLAKDKYGCPAWYESSFQQAMKNGNFHAPSTEDFPFFDKCNKLGYRCLQDMTREAFGFHYDLSADQGYPIAQWNQFKRREPIIWPGTANHEEVVWPAI
jgi:hypothetical protein